MAGEQNRRGAIGPRSKQADIFLASVLFYMMLPLLPIGIEFWITGGTVGEESTTLAAAMYAIAIGISSRSIGLFALGLTIGLSFAVVFGFVVGSTEPSANQLGVEGSVLLDSRTAALIAMSFIFVMHLVERFQRHYLNGEPLPFLPQRSGT